MNFKCSKCGAGPFNGEAGLRMHNIRKHSKSKVRKSPKKRRTTTRASASDTKEMLHAVLGEHPEGLEVKAVYAEMKKRGFKGKISKVYHVASKKDSQITKPNRHTYCLARSAQAAMVAAKEVKQTTVPETSLKELPREALELRIEHLETQLAALSRSHVSLVQGAIDV